ncbi:AlpA family transcriptional regulator [Acetobacter sp. P5B1]|uniref:helix-turn-helix transcriptional regulator n=1 Tax=Acetobacter sp. P5B1 TaxID=2762620 RepID=UPI001C041D41|nr:AlpA family phage regulatory protein [Acetobacter sp. P5B1]
MPSQDLDYIIRPATVAKMCGVDRSTIYRWVKRGDFPPPIRAGRNTSGWWASTIQRWQQALTSQETEAA